MVGKLRSSLPFDISEADRESAREELVNREVQMVLTIPADFSSNLQNPTASAKLFYEINESNPQMVKSVMDSAASCVMAALNREASAAGIQAVLGQSTLPPEQAKGAAAGLVDRVRSETAYIHPVDGLNNQMVPMMMVIASFVGAMIMGMNMQQASAAVGSRMTKWQSFTARTVINAVSAVEGLMNILFGGSLLGKDIVGLAAVALISLAVSAAVTAMRKTRHSDGSDEAVQRLETPA